jgi:hypothetical protein
MNRRLDDTDPNEMLPIDATDPGGPPDVRTDPVTRVLSGLGGATPWAPVPKQGASSGGEAFAAHASAPHAVPAPHRDETVMDPVLVDITSPDEAPALTGEDHEEHTPAAVAQRPELARVSPGDRRDSTTAPVPRERGLTPVFWAVVGIAVGAVLLGVTLVARPGAANVTARATAASVVTGAAGPPSEASATSVQATPVTPTAAVSSAADAAPPVAAPSAPRTFATVKPAPNRPPVGRPHPTSNERDIDHEL